MLSECWWSSRAAPLLLGPPGWRRADLGTTSSYWVHIVIHDTMSPAGLGICSFAHSHLALLLKIAHSCHSLQKIDREWIAPTALYQGWASLISFPSKSLVFCLKMSEWAIYSKKQVIHSFAYYWWTTWAIRSWSLFSSKRCERPERFTHIAHQIRGNERFAHF